MPYMLNAVCCMLCVLCSILPHLLARWICECVISLFTNVPRSTLHIYHTHARTHTTHLFIHYHTNTNTYIQYIHTYVHTNRYQFLFPQYKKKVVRHEAGHFLLAYLLGIPVRGCITSAREAQKYVYGLCQYLGLS